MAIFSDLPSEILLDVFEHLRDSSSGATLTKAMLCCRTWHSVISSVLYSHVSVESKLNSNASAARFASQLSYTFLVQSFRLNICQVHLMGFHIGFLKAQERLSETCGALSSLKNLRTFSLTLEEHAGQEYLLPSSAVVRVLRSLPQSVVNLNLDCESLDNTISPHSHVCDALATIIPRLQRLRLRLSHLCAAIFSALHHAAQAFSRSDSFWIAKSTSELRYAVIRLDTRPDSVFGTNSRMCDSRQEMFPAQDLAKSLHDMHQNGAFPYLRRFAVIDRVDAEPLEHNEQWNVLKVRSITEKTTMTFPWCPRGGSSSLFMIRDMSGRDWFGSLTDVANAVEGLLAWRQAHSGAQVPRRKMARKYFWDLDDSLLVPREEVIESFGVSFRLWEHEDMTRMKLLRVRTQSGFDDEDTLSEDLPIGWRWVPEGRWQWTIQQA